MSTAIAILYASTDGHTKTICEHLAKQFKAADIKTVIADITSFKSDISDFHTLIIGASVRYGKHQKNVYQFIQNNKETLNTIQTAFFSVNLVARKEEKNTPETNPYMLKFLKEIQWTADFLEVFAGKLDYQSYGFFDSLMIKLIMKFTNGPTSTTKPISYTNWNKVDAFGTKIVKSL